MFSLSSAALMSESKQLNWSRKKDVLRQDIIFVLLSESVFLFSASSFFSCKALCLYHFSVPVTELTPAVFLL